jgi:hypothetical protein
MTIPSVIKSQGHRTMEGANTKPSSSVYSVPSVVKDVVLFQAETPVQIAQARELFLEYAQSWASTSVSRISTKNSQDFPATTHLPEGDCSSQNSKARWRAVLRCIHCKRKFAK